MHSIEVILRGNTFSNPIKIFKCAKESQALASIFATSLESIFSLIDFYSFYIFGFLHTAMDVLQIIFPNFSSKFM